MFIIITGWCKFPPALPCAKKKELYFHRSQALGKIGAEIQQEWGLLDPGHEKKTGGFSTVVPSCWLGLKINISLRFNHSLSSAFPNTLLALVDTC